MPFELRAGHALGRVRGRDDSRPVEKGGNWRGIHRERIWRYDDVAFREAAVTRSILEADASDDDIPGDEVIVEE
jgi:hypothetical protein